jgi:hypothetical protein
MILMQENLIEGAAFAAALSLFPGSEPSCDPAFPMTGQGSPTESPHTFLVGFF